MASVYKEKRRDVSRGDVEEISRYRVSVKTSRIIFDEGSVS